MATKYNRDYTGTRTKFAVCSGNTTDHDSSGKKIVNMVCECGNHFKTSYVNLKPTSIVSCGCRNGSGRKNPVAGQKFGELTFLRMSDRLSSTGKLVGIFVCSCGEIFDTVMNAIYSGNTTSCGCKRRTDGIAATNTRYAGKKYNMLTFVRHAEKWAGVNTGKVPVAVWLCDCGKEAEFRISDVRHGKTTCCGCATGWDGGEARVGNKHGALTLERIVDKHLGKTTGLWRCDCGNTVTRTLVDVENSKSTPSCGCLMSSLLRSKRGYTLNDDVFATITNESAYWIGFLLADGNITKNIVTINLQTGDTGHLEKFRDFVGGNQAIKTRKDQRVTGYSCGSKKMVSDLAKWGVVPNKSLIAKPHPELAMNAHFWRGVIDGDGSIARAGERVLLCGTKEVCQGFLNFANSIHQTKATVRNYNRTIWSTGVGCGRRESSRILTELYKDATVYLDRKFKIANKMLTKAKEKYGA